MTGVTYEQIQALRDKIEELAGQHNKTMAQVCLNWTIQHKCIPLVGVRTVTQARDNLGALGWNLKESEVAELDRLARTSSTPSRPGGNKSIYCRSSDDFRRRFGLLGFGLSIHERAGL